jgi:hypothetical protein
MKPGAMFDTCASSLVTEAAWHAAIELLNLSRLQSEAIPLKTIESKLPFSAQEPKSRSRVLRRTVVKRDWKKIDVTMLGLEWVRLEEEGAADLAPPLPLPDRTENERRQSTFPWEWYSQVRTFERIGAVLESALLAYRQIVQEWFAPMAERLYLAATLPARVLVDVDMQEGQTGIMSEPMLRIRLEPLPKDSTTVVVLQPGVVDFTTFDREACSRLHELVVRLRPELAESLGATITTSRSHDMFSNFATRNLVYRWLEDDLRRIRWLGR